MPSFRRVVERSERPGATNAIRCWRRRTRWSTRCARRCAWPSRCTTTVADAWPAAGARRRPDPRLRSLRRSGRRRARSLVSTPNGEASGLRRSSRGLPWSSSAFVVPAAAGATRNRPGTWRCRTLDAMAAGGIYDHLVGGFCRYSTDARWLVPHFEKMLTDQALLARAYLHAWQETGACRLSRRRHRDAGLRPARSLDARGRALLLVRRRRRRGRRSARHLHPGELEAALPPELRQAGGRVVRDPGARQLGRSLDPCAPGRRAPRAGRTRSRRLGPPGGGSSAAGCSRHVTRRC